MRWPSFLFSQPGMHSTPLAEAPREHFIQAREAVLDQLEITVVDNAGKRLKERDVVKAMRLIGSL